MAQIAQKTYSLKPLETFLKEHPTASNKELYIICNAITPSQKSSVRAKQLRLSKKKNGAILPGNKSKVEKLSSEDLERRLINALDRQPDNANLLGKAIDFFIKVKDKASEMEEEIDIKELINLGLVKKFND